jgi:putative ABC transport system substrate-binding protein
LNAYAAELVNSSPDVIIVSFNAAQRAVQQRTRTIPIVIAATGDVAANGTVKNIARPEGNITGVANLFASISSKWLQLLKDIAPEIERAGLILSDPFARNPYLPPIEEAAPALGMTTTPIPNYNAPELARAIDAFAAEPHGGLIVIPPPPNPEDRKTILHLAMRYKLPTVWQTKLFVAEGGLVSYGSKAIDLWRRVPFFVDRILRGAKVNELPVEYPTTFELVVNLKAAKSIGLTVPPTFLVRTDELIE